MKQQKEEKKVQDKSRTVCELIDSNEINYKNGRLMMIDCMRTDGCLSIASSCDGDQSDYILIRHGGAQNTYIIG